MSRHRTPLRYPGGKQRLAPFIEELLRENDAIGWNYVEPYAGGAGVAMELLLTDKVGKVYLNDSSPHIYAFWKAIVTDPETFCRRISRCSLNLETWRRQREVFRDPTAYDVMDLGFSTFYMNRCNRSGVLNAGVIGGLKQESEWKIDARFSRRELIHRIEAIAEYSSKIIVSNKDAEVFMAGKVSRLSPQTLVYCDPPYFERAERLYLNHYKPEDHQRIARVIQTTLKVPWLVSYDGHPTICALYERRRMFKYSLQYSAIRSYAGSEVFVFSDQLHIPTTSRLSYVAAGLVNVA
ncbi:DNA adenine methylase [soil metagenome]